MPLHPTTLRRLQRIPQAHSVWEGDRRPLSALGDLANGDGDRDGECIIWVDGSEGVVRALDVVSPEMGPEAMVRALLRAMENPHAQARPARPQKIVVRNREIQFFLRGVLQELEIAIDYVPELPLIDELFRGFQENQDARPPSLPPQYANLLLEIARAIWQMPPWDCLADSDILAIAIDEPGGEEGETVYACVMGMLGHEYGVLLYRSLESLKQFRRAVLEEQAMDRLEKAFLQQDCWFLNFEPNEELEIDDDEEFDLGSLPLAAIQPNFGSVHPYEGLRPFLGEEEAIAVYIALRALHEFIGEYEEKLTEEDLQALSQQQTIVVPNADGSKIERQASVTTLPELTAELFAMLEAAELESDEEDEEAAFRLRDDLVPEDSFLSLGTIPWETLAALHENPKVYYQPSDAVEAGEGMPVVLIQTTRPKAKAAIETLQEAGGLQGIGFNPGEDSFNEDTYDLGIFRTEDGELFLFGEFDSNEPTHANARRQWNRRCQQTQGYCALILARGISGASRGQPQLRDMMAVFEAKALSAEDLGIGILQLMPQLDFEVDW